MRFSLPMFVIAIPMLACLSASADQQATTQAVGAVLGALGVCTDVAAAPATQPTTQPAVTLAAFAGKWSVKKSKDTGNALLNLAGEAAPSETWIVTCKDGKLAVTLDASVNAKKKTGPVALTVNQAKLDGTKMTLTLVQTIPGKFSSETTTTTYQFPLTQDTTLTGTFSRDHAIPSPLGSAKVHDDGTVGLTKLPG